MTKIRTPEPLASSEAHRLHTVAPRDPMVNASRVSRKHRKIVSPAEARQRQLEREEMQSLLIKLQQLVPGIPKNRKMTTLEIIQHVIDYIFDLQVALEGRPFSMDFTDFKIVNELTSDTVRLCQMSNEMSSCQGTTNGPVTQRIPSANRQPLASITL